MSELLSKKQSAEMAFIQAQRRCNVQGNPPSVFEEARKEATKFLEPYVTQTIGGRENIEIVVFEKMAEYWNSKFGCC